jgi:3-oxoadipate enol-lactonase
VAYELAYTTSERTMDQCPIVFLGALGSERSIWADTVAALLDHGLNTVTVDLRGHGDSVAPTGPYTIAELADDVLHTLDALGAHTVDLAGLSLGGAVAQHIAATSPDRVASLTLLSTSSRFGTREAWTERAATVRTSGTDGLVSGLAGRWITYERAQKDPALLRCLGQMVRRTDREGYAACADALAEWDGTDLLSAIASPTLVLGGVDDQSTTPEVMAGLARKIPNARNVIIEPGAHLLPVERPELVSSLIAEHVKANRQPFVSP